MLTGINVYAGASSSHSTLAQGRNGWFTSQVVGSESHRGSSSLDDVVLSEDFEDIVPGALPPNWSEVDRDSGYCSWFRQRSFWQAYDRPGFSAHSGTRFAMCYYNDNSVPNDDWLILPRQTLAGTVTLSYWAASQDPDYPESYEIRVSTDSNQPQDFTNLVYTGTNISSDWTQYSHDLSAFAGQSFYVAFHYVSVNRFALKVDDVQLSASGTQTGVIAGTVTDDSSRGIDYAKVQITLLGRSVRTDSTGAYVLPGIRVGSYNVSVLSEFHSPQLLPGTVVTANDTTPLNVSLAALPLHFRHYATTFTPRDITDFDTTQMRLDMADTVVIWDMDITVSLLHTSVGDLDIWLKSPSNHWVELAAHDSLNAGQNMLNCRFDDQADLSFSAGQAPYTGRFRPVQSLGILDGDSLIKLRGSDVHGRDWFLYVYDAVANDQGSLLGWSMDVAWQVPESATPHETSPQSFSFSANYPNPFNSETHFRFSLARTGPVKLVLYNILGQEAARVYDGKLDAGDHDLLFEAASLSSGVYIARLSSQSASLSRKLLLIK